MTAPIILNPQILADIYETREIDPLQLLEHIQAGWHVLGTFERHVVISAGGWLNGRQIEHPAEQHMPIILVGRTETAALRRRITVLENSQKDRDILSKKVADLEKQIQSLKSNEEYLKTAQKHSSEALETQREQTRKERERNHRLEQDIGKIRSALGDIRMKEVLGT